LKSSCSTSRSSSSSGNSDNDEPPAWFATAFWVLVLAALFACVVNSLVASSSS
jgi:hypothetical protein